MPSTKRVSSPCYIKKSAFGCTKSACNVEIIVQINVFRRLGDKLSFVALYELQKQSLSLVTVVVYHMQTLV